MWSGRVGRWGRVSDFFFTKNPFFLGRGCGGGIFHKLTRNPNLTFFFFGGGGGGGGGRVSVCA